MMLSEQEKEALERYRSDGTFQSWEEQFEDVRILARAIDRLFPPGWDDPVTVEGLVALGGVLSHPIERGGIVTFDRGLEKRRLDFFINGDSMFALEEYADDELPDYCFPRNMKEARELLERCGAIGTKGDQSH